MTDSAKLRLKVGPHEFEAEGPEEVVAKYLAVWREAIGQSAPAPGLPAPVTPNDDVEVVPLAPPPPADVSSQDDSFPKEQLARLIVFDDRRGVYRLRVIPTGGDAVGDAVLLLLYGALRARGEDEMLATKLVGALESSGMNVQRIDRDAGGHMRQRWITRYGVGKGGRYRLTSTGMIQARRVAEALLAQVAG